MSKLDEAAVLKRAKELCAANGTSWEVEANIPKSKGRKLIGSIDDEGRERYHCDNLQTDRAV